MVSSKWIVLKKLESCLAGKEILPAWITSADSDVLMEISRSVAERKTSFSSASTLRFDNIDLISRAEITPSTA
ncbi:hypothetical protein LEP1GSC090_1758 [Leptospira borgpetersenii serovar Javanica str. MK146]|nr:hypothetical protein LEP1GSC090_1758 [Leptospira borgpetersenii serovar Javanica str. MK146]